jgi:2-polyprenyl-3-methyl-5-hydroxy-6-metoxy-1,4-benzoquinol methylase
MDNSNSLQSQEYWNKENRWFQEVYKDTLLQRFIHSPVKLREKLAVSTATLANAKTILDIGCGQCSVLISAIKSSGASSGIAIDFSQQMIRYAESKLEKHELLDKVILQQRDVADERPFQEADVAFALGLFDYVAPVRVLEKAHKAASIVVASWPEKTVRNFLRNFRYDCEVYKYTRPDVISLLSQCGASKVFVYDLGWNSGFATISISN